MYTSISDDRVASSLHFVSLPLRRTWMARVAISRLQFLDGAGGGSLVENLLRSLSSAAALSVECEGYNVGQGQGNPHGKE